MKKMLMALCGLGLISWVCSAAPVKEIVIQSGSGQEISETLVRSNMTLKVGSEFSRKQLSEDVKRLYKTQEFDDVEVSVDSVDDGIKITITLVPKPRVAGIEFRGNSKMKDRTLRNKLTQKVGESVSESKLATDLRSIYDLYHGKGYHDVAVNPKRVKIEGTNDVNIVYEVEERARYKIRGVEFVGNTILSSRQLGKIAQTDVSFWGYMFPTGYFNAQQFQMDQDGIKREYLNRGYLDFAVTKVDQRYNAKKTKVYLTIHIKEGQPYTVSSTKVEGSKEFTTEELAAKLSMKQGMVYSAEVEKKDLERITDMYNRKGFLDFSINADLARDGANRQVSVIYQLREGLASSIRNINITGNEVTHDNVIRREMKIHPGDLSDLSKIQASKASLMNLGYFKSVDVIPVSTQELSVKDLDVSVEEQPTGQLRFGAGISSAESVMGEVELSQSNFALLDPWKFRGAGQRFRITARAGSRNNSFGIAFTEPWLFDRPLRLDYNIWRSSTYSNRGWEQTALGTGFTLTRRMESPFWRQSFGYRLQEIEIEDIDDDYSAAFINEEEGSELSSVITLGLIRDQRDRIINTTSGSRLALNMELQSQAWGSYTNAAKLSITGTQWLPVFKKSVLRLHGEISTLDKFSGDDPKVFDRFFTGGADSIRGFKERDVGPVDPANQEPVGGNSVLLGSVELSAPIYEDNVHWAVFADAGNAWIGEYDWDPGDINVGAGVGVRLNLPVGAFRIDYGWPIVRQQEHLNTGGRLHFDLGYRF